MRHTNVSVLLATNKEDYFYVLVQQMTFDITGLYCERQRGGSCRIHAINNLFGKTVVTESSFKMFQVEYKKHLRADHVLDSSNTSLSTNEDSIESTRDFIIPFILSRLFQLTSFWIAPYEFSKLKNANILRGILDVMDFDQNRFFVINMTHVWCCKKVKDRFWVQIDSISGIRQIDNIDQLVENKQLGFLMPWGKKRATHGVSEMQCLVTDYFGPQISQGDICVMLLRDLSKREPHHFGDCQIWIALFFKYLKFIDTDKHHFDSEIKAFEDYERHRASSPLDLVHAIGTLPCIITFIVNEFHLFSCLQLTG